MPITVTTVYSKERLMNFVFFNARRKVWFWLLMAACTLYTIGLWISLRIIYGLYSTTVSLCVLYILVLDLFALFTNFVLPRFTVKKHKLLDSDVTYVFDEAQMQLTAATAELSENFSLRYSALHKVIKHKTALYLYISSRQAYIADLSAVHQHQEVLLKNAISAALKPKKVRW